jgi:hypothetical protein
MPELAALVQALKDPRTYPHSPKTVELVQTQISFVFIAGDYVYKVKKPVDFGFLDFTTLEKRHFYCNQEVVLNRRLCSDVYLGVASITQKGKGFAVEGNGKAVEYAVKMRPLPYQRMMDRMLQRDEVTPKMLDRVAGRLADFHRQAELTEELAEILKKERSTIRKESERRQNTGLPRRLARCSYLLHQRPLYLRLHRIQRQVQIYRRS